MCSEGHTNTQVPNSCINSTVAEPSELDLNAIIHIYGNDGFRMPNQRLEPDSFYQLDPR